MMNPWEISALSNLRMQPSTVKEKFHLELVFTHPLFAQIYVLDLQGRLVFQIQASKQWSSGTHRIHSKMPRQLSMGIYFLIVSAADGQNVLLFKKT